MRRMITVAVLAFVCISMIACSKTDSSDNESHEIQNVKMEKSSEDYLKEQWNSDDLVKHFEEMGFTDVVAEGFAPSNDDNIDDYKRTIFDISIKNKKKAINEWNAGDEFPSDSHVSISYNNRPPLTVENCEEMQQILWADDIIKYDDFVEMYDGYAVEFDAQVTLKTNTGAGTYFTVRGMNEAGDVVGMNIRIGDRIWNNDIDKSAEEGDIVHVFGLVDKDQSYWFKFINVQAFEMKKKE